MRSYLFRTLAFWGTFYTAYHYARRDPATLRHVYPSYFILKEKVIKDTWKNGFEDDNFSTAFRDYRVELWSEIKSIWN